MSFECCDGMFYDLGNGYAKLFGVEYQTVDHISSLPETEDESSCWYVASEIKGQAKKYFDDLVKLASDVEHIKPIQITSEVASKLYLTGYLEARDFCDAGEYYGLIMISKKLPKGSCEIWIMP